MGKTSYFRAKCVNIQYLENGIGNTVKVVLHVLITNRKSHGIGTRSMTLDDTEFEFLENFAGVSRFGRQQLPNVYEDRPVLSATAL